MAVAAMGTSAMASASRAPLAQIAQLESCIVHQQGRVLQAAQPAPGRRWNATIARPQMRRLEARVSPPQLRIVWAAAMRAALAPQSPVALETIRCASSRIHAPLVASLAQRMSSVRAGLPAMRRDVLVNKSYSLLAYPSTPDDRCWGLSTRHFKRTESGSMRSEWFQRRPQSDSHFRRNKIAVPATA
jgi:hypothetical protein